MDISGVTITESEPLAEDQTQPQEKEPINTVNTFWERLDEVLVNLEGTKDLSQVPARPFLNQPDRVYISSNDDQSQAVAQMDTQEQSFSEFNVTLTKPLLGVKSIQLVSATIPQGGLSIPDQECVFWYYKIAPADIDNNPLFIPTNLYYVRLLPSYYKPELVYNYSITGYKEWVSTTTYGNGSHVTYNGFQYISIQAGNLNKKPDLQPSWWTEEADIEVDAATTYGFNRSFVDVADLQTQLVKACAHDPLYSYYQNQGGEPTTYRFLPNEVIISAGSDGLFEIEFLDDANYYIAAGYNDPNVTTGMQALYSRTGSKDFLSLMPSSYGQPFTIGRTLNLRLGFTWDGNNRGPINNFGPTYNDSTVTLMNRFRPIPYDENIIGGTGLINLRNITVLTVYSADAPPNLVLSNRILIYADFVGPSSTGSGNNESLLCSVANAGTLGVLNYMATFHNPLTKVAPEIYTIGIRMRSDTLMPYTLPNSAIVGIELAIQYF